MEISLGFIPRAQLNIATLFQIERLKKLRSFINQIVDIRQANYEDPYIDLWSSINLYMVLQKKNYGDPQIELWRSVIRW